MITINSAYGILTKMMITPSQLNRSPVPGAAGPCPHALWAAAWSMESSWYHSELCASHCKETNHGYSWLILGCSPRMHQALAWDDAISRDGIPLGVGCPRDCYWAWLNLGRGGVYPQEFAPATTWWKLELGSPARLAAQPKLEKVTRALFLSDRVGIC